MLIRHPIIVGRLSLVALVIQIPASLTAQMVSAASAAAPGLAPAAELVERARAAAQANRNGEAADLFERALQVSPGLRPELLREYADQLTYSDRSAKAVPLYAEVLARRDLAPDEAKRVRRGYALALSWSGQHKAAINQYDRLLGDNSEDRNARLDRAKVLGWDRQYGRAQAEYRYLLARDTNDREARQGLADIQSFMGHPRAAIATLQPIAGAADRRTGFLLARAQQWSGRSDLAGATLAHSSPLEDGEAMQLGRYIANSRVPLTVVSARTSHQSDQTSIREVAASQSIVGPGAIELLSVQVSNERFHQQGGTTVTITRPGAHARLRLSDDVTVSAEGAIAFQSGAGKNDHYPLFNLFATIIPSDTLRFDGGVSRTTFDNIGALQRRIDVTEYGASVDLGSDTSWKLSARANRQDFSDGNGRLWGQGEVRRRLAWSPNIFLGLRGTAFRYSQLLNNGYYNPRSLRAVEVTGQAWGKIGRAYFDLRGAVGKEDTNPGGTKTIYSTEAHFSHPLTSRVEGEVYVSRFSSRFNTNSGFARTTLGANLKVRW